MNYLLIMNSAHHVMRTYGKKYIDSGYSKMIGKNYILPSFSLLNWTLLYKSLKTSTIELVGKSRPLLYTNNFIGNTHHDKIQIIRLNNLRDNPGSVKKSRRVGRGIGCSKGKTCGRGHKGQKARSKVKPTFEGGQTTFIKRLPKSGFRNKTHAKAMTPINVGTIQDYIDMGRLSIHGIITMKELVQAGICKNSAIPYGIKLLGKGKSRFHSEITIEISRASKMAIATIEQAGGKITTVHYNRLALRALLKPEKFDILPKRARPPPKYMNYYRSWDNRGYLSPEIQMRLLKNNVERKHQCS